MHHIIYLSQAVKPFTDHELADLLLVARSHNARQAITGLLLYGNNQFMQVLEGEETAVRALYEHIKRDVRHRDATTFADKEIDQRAFAEWAMAFHSVTPTQLLDLGGYTNLDAVQFDQAELRQADKHLIELLRSFVLPIAPPHRTLGS